VRNKAGKDINFRFFFH